METISIRELNGETLRDYARRGRPLAITNYRELVGVFIPNSTDWIEHLVHQSWSQLHQNITEAEREMASSEPMTSLNYATADVDRSRAESTRTEVILRQLQDALTLPAAGDEDRPNEPGLRTVRIGELKAHVIEDAGKAGQSVAVTYEGTLIGVVIPVTPSLVQFLIEQQMSRVLYNVGEAERESRSARKQIALTDAKEPESSRDRESTRHSL